MGISKIKGKEKGLWYEVKILKETIALRKKLGKDTKFEEKLLKEWRKNEE